MRSGVARSNVSIDKLPQRSRPCSAATLRTPASVMRSCASEWSPTVNPPGRTTTAVGARRAACLEPPRCRPHGQHELLAALNASDRACDAAQVALHFGDRGLRLELHHGVAEPC